MLGLGFGVSDFGVRGWLVARVGRARVGREARFRVVGFGVQGSGLRLQGGDLGFRVRRFQCYDTGFTLYVLGFMVCSINMYGSGFRGSGFG